MSESPQQHVRVCGQVAAATSTGGITFGMPGRVGDSPLVGLGCLADNSLGALSATGHGESIMRLQLGTRILLAAEGGVQPIGAAVGAGLAAMHERVQVTDRPLLHISSLSVSVSLCLSLSVCLSLSLSPQPVSFLSLLFSTACFRASLPPVSSLGRSFPSALSGRRGTAA